MKNRLRSMLLLALLLALGTLPGARSSEAQKDPGKGLSAADRASQYLDEIRRSTSTPAISGAVALGGKIVFSGGSGEIDIENSFPATGQSVYNIGSVSKAITAIAVLQLVESDKVSLDDDIRKYVPSFPDKGATITVRHLLTHTSGIRHYHDNDFPGTPDNENNQPLTWEEGLKIFAQDQLLFVPGKNFFYTSYGVNLLQGVVEKGSGMSFEQYLSEHVFKPAGMVTAGFDIPNREIPNRAKSYRLAEGKPVEYYYNDIRYKFASGGMIASAEDLVRLASAVNHDSLMRPATKQAMLSSQARGLREFREGGTPRKMAWIQGMLWRLRYDAKGRLVAYACGSVKASNACVVDFLKEDLAAAIATNSWECCGWSKADSLAAIFRTAPSHP